jgi:nucleoside-diphosphate-sugar epimerase
MEKVFVTGASGRIGSHVIPLLLERGISVRAMVRKTPLPEAWRGQVETVDAAAPWEEAIGGMDAVVHLAALMPPASDDEVFRANIEATYRLLNAAAAQKAKPRVLFASSDATYCTGWSLQSYTEPIGEGEPQHPTVFYGLSKVLGERMCLYYEEMHQLPIVRLRFVWTLTAEEILKLFTETPYKEFVVDADRANWESDGVVAVPLEEDGRPFQEHLCDVRDAADAVLLALESSAAPGRAFNIAGPEAFHYTDISPKLADLLGARAVAARCRGIHSYSLDIGRAKKELGYRPRFSVFDSLNDALATARAKS